MKLWYQSMSRQTEWGGDRRVLRGIAMTLNASPP